jgi:hypothetical protein
MGTYSSATRQGAYEPFDLQVSRNQVDGHAPLNIYGYQTALTTTFIPVWENATAYTYPVSAMTMYLAGSVGDTASIVINGLDANYAQISETLVLNGTTQVATVNQYLRINSMQVSVGSSTNPSGAVVLTNSGASVTYAKINAGVGRTQSAIYTVPAGYTFYLSRADANTSLNGNNANYVTYRNYTISSAGVVNIVQQAPFSGNYHTQRVMPRAFNEKTDIQIQCATSSGTAAVNVAIEGYLIKNAD